MNDRFPSLIATDVTAGLNLAGDLSDQIHARFQTANEEIPRPGGMNFLLPPPVPKEVIASVLFYVIAIANQGWKNPA